MSRTLRLTDKYGVALHISSGDIVRVEADASPPLVATHSIISTRSGERIPVVETMAFINKQRRRPYEPELGTLASVGYEIQTLLDRIEDQDAQLLQARKEIHLLMMRKGIW